jgi:hypothetical protein
LPVSARPDTFSYRAGKFIKRNSFSVLAAALILLAVVGGVLRRSGRRASRKPNAAKAESRFNDVRKLAKFLFV